MFFNPYRMVNPDFVWYNHHERKVLTMDGNYGYSVRTDFGFPILIRYKNHEVEIYTANGTWEREPGLDSILIGEGDFVWYDDIDESKALEYMKEIDKNVNEK